MELIDNLTKKKLAIVATTPKMVNSFLINHMISFSKIYNVTVLTNIEGQSYPRNMFPINVKVYNIPIARAINIFYDIKSLYLLIMYLYRENISVIYSISPKGGLLSITAGWLVCVPVRIHTFTGQVWFTKKGITKWLLKMIDKIISLLSTVIIVDSASQREFLLSNKVVSDKKSFVLGNGSISGVDIKRFFPSKGARERLRAKMRIHNSTIVFLFVGRLKKDKGVLELINAFAKIYNLKKMSLWFVGDDEENLLKELEGIACAEKISVDFFSYTTAPEEYMQAADVFCLPSYREGFGSTIIEAAACGIPAIGSRIYGITDAIIDGETGILVEKGVVNELASTMLEFAKNDYLRKKMGERAMKVAIEKYNPDLITKELVSIVNKQLFRESVFK
jgi:glycosyltransferase involved in cell wall biosynthesis